VEFFDRSPGGIWRRRLAGIACPIAAAALLASCNPGPGGGKPDSWLISPDDKGEYWASYGRTYNEDHFSSADQIDTSNVARLGLEWAYDIDVPLRADSQPLFADGKVYIATGLSVVQAIEAKTGRTIWRYDPGVAKVAGKKLYPSWGIRGLALWKDKVIFGTQDGRLMALDARDGKELWSTQTLGPDVDQSGEATITGAPRVFDGKVLIGFGGAERGSVRGAISCYDAETGKRLWRFYTVPGDPAKGFENAAMKMAAQSWSGEWWKFGPGGTVWNAITYDPEFRRIYVGTGNGGPWNWKIRNPKGGDALFLNSIIALDADTGEYVWHYQENPNEAWDYNAAMDITLAELEIDGKPRKVLMQAPKNGFLYVIDRATGKLVSAEKLGKVTWAEGVDLKSGRPIEKPGIRYENGPVVLWPGTFGIHNWQPMSFSPRTGLLYIPAIRQADAYSSEGVDTANWKPTENAWNTGMGDVSAVKQELASAEFSSSLLAWDPVRKKAAWQIPTPGIVNGGTMATGGGLVFQGLIDGTFNAFDAASGARLWSFDAGVSVLGAPITYVLDGVQYVTVLAGPPSGAAAGSLTSQAKFGWRYEHPRRLLTFRLDGKARLPETAPPGPATPIADPPGAARASADQAAQGAALYGNRCGACHGVGAVASGGAPDLRASGIPLDPDTFANVVQGGLLLSRGMPGFPDLDGKELEALRLYIRGQATGGGKASQGQGAGP